MPFYNSEFARKLYCVAVLAFLSGFIPWLHPAAGQDGNASTISLTINPGRQAAVDSANNVWSLPEYGITVRLPAPAPGQPSAGRVQPLAPENPWQQEILRESKSLGFKDSVACLIIPDGHGNVTFGAEKGLSISFYWNRANASPEAFYFDPWYRTLVPLAAWSNPGENTLEVVLDRAGVVVLAVPGEVRFSDLPDTHWAAPSIRTLAQKNIIRASQSGEVHPQDQLTRAESARMAALAGRIPGFRQGEGFRDIPAGYWGCPYIRSLQAAGAVSGCGGGEFRPEAAASRGEFIKMAVLALNLRPSSEFKGWPPVPPFSDLPDNHWALPHIRTALENSLIQGYPDQTLRVDQPISRAEAAVILDRAVSRQGLIPPVSP